MNSTSTSQTRADVRHGHWSPGTLATFNSGKLHFSFNSTLENRPRRSQVDNSKSKSENKFTKALCEGVRIIAPENMLRSFGFYQKWKCANSQKEAGWAANDRVWLGARWKDHQDNRSFVGVCQQHMTCLLFLQKATRFFPWLKSVVCEKKHSSSWLLFITACSFGPLT